MKKLLGILVLGLFLFAETANAKKTKLVTGKDYEGEIIWVKGSKIKLPPGKFRLIERFQWTSWGISAKSSWFANFKEGVWDGIWMGWYKTGSKKYEIMYEDGEQIYQLCWDSLENSCDCSWYFENGCD